MKSSTGEYWLALDHVRALACLMVFAFHFMHGWAGVPVSNAGAPAVFPLALFDEGHTGVALFMALSGYLFAKLLDGKRIAYGPFLLSRFFRLAPMLSVAFALGFLAAIINGFSLSNFAYVVLVGPVLPTWPHSAWSITVEIHFYLLLPVLLYLTRRSPLSPLALIGAAILLRCLLTLAGYAAQDLAYWTIIGRIDQFLLGIFAFQFRDWLRGRHTVAAASALAFASFYWAFDALGGFVDFGETNPLWIVMPSIEGAAYALMIAWYDSSFKPENRGLSKLAGKIGTWSYSIYLLHHFYVLKASRFIDTHVMDLSNFYVAFVWALITFLATLPIGWLGYRFVEQPFLRMRGYAKIPDKPAAASPATSAAT